MKRENRPTPDRDKWLRIAKQQRRHAEQRMEQKKQEGEVYGVLVYRCRINALNLYIKTLQSQYYQSP